MKKLLLLLTLLSFSDKIFAQRELEVIDSVLDKAAPKSKHPLKMIKIGTRRIGTAFFYFKTTDSVYSIVDRKQFFSGNKHLDSVSEYKYFFLNDNLVKVIHNRGKTTPRSSGYEYLYFHNNRLLGRLEFKDSPITDVSFLLREADDLLKKAKSLQAK